MKVTYYHHSGFSVELENTVLLFDYYTQDGKYNGFAPEAYEGKKLLVFVSHAHGDHYDRSIWKFAQRAVYLLPEDIAVPAGVAAKAVHMTAHEETTVEGVQIKTLLSNDEGMAFMVKAEGKTIYHAGDLNWWHWNGESDAFNEDIRQSYCGEIDRLKGEKIDAAFVPVDPRLEDKYCWAADYFMEQIGADALFPMHFWRHFSICRKLAEKPYGEKVMEITGENVTFDLP
ncbi:MBL fold metallo-hydrolase [Anaerotignum lactatifermentans]|uniref:MBL fold metallo-hydrolase n=1 Tax=Anaerotignum lactatifermentans TaxID=160404 RepID=A0ABS2GAA1_9FIRM|nr:MBL fold metallo-hydrolase [Anaerotignum lactatifermentans]MBM6829892.1 MBL fold metallo-hydrolase [Anaerotignum lactatifermentans]MBM6878394.1 MBL fold metallo-hydrolase [Anaerotignum lactatifermentans]MBM6951549.1 MBL fold metallo-hydrolase [Anaerotignum lactatifermentans]